MSRLRSGQTLIASLALLLIVAVIGSGTSAGTQQDFITALVSATIVYGLYVFVGNSGVISFGHISFAAIGAFMAGVLTIPTQPKHFVLPGLWSFLATHTVSTFVSLVIAAGLGAVVALIVGLPLMRLSGIAAGIGTFAVLEITNNLFQQWTKIGPGPTTLSLVPVTVGVWQALGGAAFAAVVAFAYQSSRRGRLLRASREDPAAAQAVGVNITRERLIAFGLSGALAGLGGGLLVHQLGSVTTDQVYLELTFLTLAMLVIGGSASLWGATVGALAISLLDSWLAAAENTVHVIFFSVTLPNGAADLILGVIMAAMLLFRPTGITGGAEFSLGFLRTLPFWRSREVGLRDEETGNEHEAEREPLEQVEPMKPS
jgi:branched-chain amino acid transport system permease protein